MTLGFDWAPGNLTEPAGTEAGWQFKNIMTWLISFSRWSQLTSVFFFLRCWQKLNMQLIGPHNTQRLVGMRQGEPAVCLNQLSSPQSQDLETKSSYRSSERVILSCWWEGRIRARDSLSRIGRSVCAWICHGQFYLMKLAFIEL